MQNEVKELQGLINVFIRGNRKICWESEMEQGEYCIGENKMKAFIDKLSKDQVSEINRLRQSNSDRQLKIEQLEDDLKHLQADLRESEFGKQ